MPEAETEGSEQCSADMIIGALTMEKGRGQCLHDGAMDATMTRREAMNATMQTQWCHDKDKDNAHTIVTTAMKMTVDAHIEDYNDKGKIGIDKVARRQRTMQC